MHLFSVYFRRPKELDSDVSEDWWQEGRWTQQDASQRGELRTMGRQHKGVLAQSAAFPIEPSFIYHYEGSLRLAWVTSPHSCAPWLIIWLLPNPVELRPKINHCRHTRTPGFCHSLSNRPRQAPFRFIPVTWLNLIAKKTMKSNLYSWSPCAKQKTCWLQHKMEMGAGGELIQGGRHWLSPTAISSLENSLRSKGLSMPSLSSTGKTSAQLWLHVITSHLPKL